MISQVELSTHSDSIVIMTGDFNTNPEAFQYRLFVEHGLNSAPGQLKELTLLDVHEGNHIVTWGSTSNSWFTTPVNQEKLDYILYEPSNIELLSKKLIFDKPVDGVFVSDHFGIEATFKIRSHKKASKSQKTSDAQRDLVRKASSSYVSYLNALDKRRKRRLVLVTLFLVLFSVSFILSFLYPDFWFSKIMGIVQILSIVLALFHGAVFGIFINDEIRSMRQYKNELDIRLSYQ